ncbi:hypothetical protein OPQ81_006737 [Rhizoctonia solani]|nr:hypothetical protein OPQ81_006737 [Rhizoctonia solani]
MRSLSLFVTALSLTSCIFAASLPPTGSITVGSKGKYKTLAAALEDTGSDTYFIYSGNYTGQTTITRANIKIYGETTNAQAYGSNTVTFTDNIPASVAGDDERSATIRVQAAGVSFYNLNIVNTYGKQALKSQAIALSVEQGKFACYACQIKGYQDTLLAESGTQFYGKSYIEGAVDYIFGQRGSIWVTKSTLKSIGNGCITASGRSSPDNNYYVIDNSTIEGTGTVYLGRPWAAYARVIFQNNNIGSNVVAAGWQAWNSTTPRTDHVLFGEYNNNGMGAWRSGRAGFATKLSTGVSITTVLGSTGWIDQAYL